MTVGSAAQPDAVCGDLDSLVAAIPQGWSRVDIAGEPWAVTRATHAGGKVISLSAEQLGGTEQLSANVWITSKGPILRPCEVPADMVLRFLRAASDVYAGQPAAAGGEPDRAPAGQMLSTA